MLIFIEGADPNFWETYHSLESPEELRIKVKIWQWLHQKFLVEKNRKNYYDILDCHEGLLNIMDMMCPTVAKYLKPYLDIMEFHLNMTRDEEYAGSYLGNNCSHLQERNAEICQLILSRDTPFVRFDEFTKIMNDCNSEYLEQDDRHNASLSYRYSQQSWSVKVLKFGLHNIRYISCNF